MALSIGEAKLQLIKELKDLKNQFLSLAAGSGKEKKLEDLYRKLDIAFREYANDQTVAFIPTQAKPTTNIYFDSTGKIIGADHRDYEKEYWDQRIVEQEARKSLSEQNLLEILDQLNRTLDSIPKIKEYRENRARQLREQAERERRQQAERAKSAKAQIEANFKKEFPICCIVLGIAIILGLIGILAQVSALWRFSTIISLICAVFALYKSKKAQKAMEKKSNKFFWYYWGIGMAAAIIDYTILMVGIFSM